MSIRKRKNSQNQSLGDIIRSVYHILCDACMYNEQCYQKNLPYCLMDEAEHEMLARLIFFSDPAHYDAAINVLKQSMPLRDGGFLNIGTRMHGEDGLGVTVVYVPEGSDIGIHASDCIVKIDGHEVMNNEDIRAVEREKRPGDTVIVTVVSATGENGKDLPVKLCGKDQVYPNILQTTSLAQLAAMADKISCKAPSQKQ